MTQKTMSVKMRLGNQANRPKQGFLFVYKFTHKNVMNDQIDNTELNSGHK